MFFNSSVYWKYDYLFAKVTYCIYYIQLPPQKTKQIWTDNYNSICEGFIKQPFTQLCNGAWGLKCSNAGACITA